MSTSTQQVLPVATTRQVGRYALALLRQYPRAVWLAAGAGTGAGMRGATRGPSRRAAAARTRSGASSRKQR